MPPVLAIAVVAKDLRHGSHRRHRVLRSDFAERRGETREGVGLLVREPEPAAGEQRVRRHLAALDAAHQRAVVGPGVDAVVVGQRDADLELARQVGRAVERLW